MSKVRGHVNMTNTLSGTLEVQQTQLVPSCLQLCAFVCTCLHLRAIVAVRVLLCSSLGLRLPVRVCGRTWVRPCSHLDTCVFEAR